MLWRDRSQRGNGISDEGLVRILISGASGLIGRALAEGLRAAGHTVQTLVRATRVDGAEAVGHGDPAQDARVRVER